MATPRPDAGPGMFNAGGSAFGEVQVDRNRSAGERVEVLPMDEASSPFAVPTLAQATVSVLGTVSALITWRVAARVAEALRPLVMARVSGSPGLPRIDPLSGLTTVARSLSFVALLLAAMALITHFSKYIHARLNARGIATASGAVMTWQLSAICLVFFFRSNAMLSVRTLAVETVVGLVGYSLLASGARQFLRAQQYMALDADAVLATDPRPAVLYLRSFAQDDQDAPLEPEQPEHMRRPGERVFLPRFWLARRHLTFEELLCKAIGSFAPVVTIGRPSEPLPRLGAARKYVADNLWKTEVLRLYEMTRFTCVVVGSSKGVHWELTALLNLGNPHKIAVIFPPDADPQRIWDGVDVGSPGWPGKSGLAAVARQARKGMLAVVFGADGRPVLVSGRPTLANYRKLARLMNHHHPRDDRGGRLFGGVTG